MNGLATEPFYEIRAELSNGHIASVEILSQGNIDISRLVTGRPCSEVPDILASILAICTEAHRAASQGAIEQAIGPAPGDDVKRRRAKAVLTERFLNGLWRLAIDWPRVLDRAEQPALVAAAKHMLQANGPFQSAEKGLNEILAATEANELLHSMVKAAHLQERERSTALLADRIARASVEPRTALAALVAIHKGEPVRPEWCGDGGTVQTSRGMLIHIVAVSVDRVSDYSIITPTDRIMAPGGVVEQALTGLGGPEIRRRAYSRLAILDPCAAVEISLVENGHA